uniref:HD domain-containing protein n=1 Tax=Chromera velia CCMP2878 TaxID=1169474 RepID=A0A0G4GGY6_9ALVE|eukprot:Cvel_21863.t1-p1 / transcript=Cvel_21863.t1 / gene=Cvel_21863 / organism=Chromera_velia_CCMP2878 / gene_product=HD domain-containing protein 2, putative / transcript_product=HD domain-containing protein 2, putative / location=Cvel_scaffold2089:33648-34967(+) / protein_length=440 / sequence_SO=supercontig / SO=protein_coding / is_pseudo=false
MDERLGAILVFLQEAEKLKTVYRTADLSSATRKESSAEHSWHVAVCALLLSPELGLTDGDTFAVVLMLLVHDLIEVYAGDTAARGGVPLEVQKEKEMCAADRLFGFLPEDVRKRVRGLWEEFEKRETKCAKVARALDSLQVMIQNSVSGGTDFIACGSTLASETAFLEERGVGQFPPLMAIGKHILEESEKKGWLKPSAQTPSAEWKVDPQGDGMRSSCLSWLQDRIPAFHLFSETGLTIEAPPESDFWCNTFYDPLLLKTNAPALVTSVPVSQTFTLEVDFSLIPKRQFDQGGVLVWCNSSCWMKAGLEFCDGRTRLSVVTTNDNFSDWSSEPVCSSGAEGEGVSVSLRVSRLISLHCGSSLLIERKGGDGQWQMVRISPLRVPSDLKVVMAGVYAASPTKVTEGGAGVSDSKGEGGRTMVRFLRLSGLEAKLSHSADL